MVEADDRWAVLVARTRAVLRGVAAVRGTTTYAELLDELGGAPEGEGELARLLREVSVESDRDGEGLLTALVVRAPGKLPGGGFFELAAQRGRDTSDRQRCWEAELTSVWDRAHVPG